MSRTFLCLVAALALTPVLWQPQAAEAGARPTRRGTGGKRRPELLFAHPQESRRLRGDYEPIDLLVLTYQQHFEGALRTIIRHAAPRVAVQLLFDPDERAGRRFARWSKRRCVDTSAIPYNTGWVRDYGPLQTFEGQQPLWVDFGYAADRELDDLVPSELAEQHGIALDVQVPILEGGAIVSNGRGVCAISDRNLLETGIDPRDNRALGVFVARLGCRVLAVLPALPAEQTGHTDVTVQFLAADRVAVAAMDRGRAPLDAALLDHAAWLLQQAAAALGQGLEVVRVPLVAEGGAYFAYLNGTRIDDVYLVPSYRAVPRALQRRAYKALQAAMPGVTLVPVPSDEMVELGGAVHCITLGLSWASGRWGQRPGGACRRKNPKREMGPKHTTPRDNGLSAASPHQTQAVPKYTARW